MLKIKDVVDNRRYMLGAFFIVLLLYLIRICTTVDVNISLDEIGTFASGATLGGRDWFGVFPFTRYYGYGFYWIFAPLFYLTDNPYILYIVIYFVNSIIVALTSVLIYKCATTELGFKNGIVTMLFSILPSVVYCIVNYAYITNDTIAYLGYWLVIYYLLRLFDGLEKKKNTILLSFSVCYLLTVHERTIIIICIVVALLILWRIAIKESIVDWKIFGISIVAFYLLARISKKIIINIFWADIKAGTLANTSAIYNDIFWFVGDLEKFKIIIDVFVANVIKLGNATYGIIYIVLAVVLILFIDFLKGGWCFNTVKNASVEEKKLIFITAVSLLAVFGTIAGLALQWSQGIYKSDRYALGKSIRAYTYLRYYIGYIGPALFAAYKAGVKKNWRKPIIKIALLIMLVCVGYYLLEVNPYLKGQTLVLEMISLSDNSIINRSISVLIIGICIYLMGCIYKKQNSVMYVIIIGVLVLNMYIPSNFSAPRLESNQFDSTYKCIKMLEKEDVLVEKISFVNSSSSGGYQFFLNKYGLNLWNGEEVGIIVSNRGIAHLPEDTALLLMDVDCIKLDDNEWIYVFDENIKKTLIKKGYKIEPSLEAEVEVLFKQLEIDEKWSVIVENENQINTLGELGYIAEIGERLVQRNKPTVMLFRSMEGVDIQQLKEKGYYVYELAGGYIATNDVDLFVKIESIYDMK